MAFEIKITIDTLEEQDNKDLLNMFIIMCAFSGCVHSTSELHINKEEYK